jgi:hypothetical protein
VVGSVAAAGKSRSLLGIAGSLAEIGLSRVNVKLAHCIGQGKWLADNWEISAPMPYDTYWKPNKKGLLLLKHEVWEI